jgi:hypothetical protein
MEGINGAGEQRARGGPAVVLAVHLDVLGELRHALGEEGYLHLR